MFGERRRFYTNSAAAVPSEGIFRCPAEPAAAVCRDWLTRGGHPGVLGRALGQEISLRHQTINPRRAPQSPQSEGLSEPAERSVRLYFS